MHPTPRACPLGSAFPPETGDESPHSGRASGARSAGPTGGPPGCAPAFPEPGTHPAARRLPAPSGACFDVRGGGTDRATESGRGRGRNFADLQRGGHPERAAAAGLAGLQGSDSGRGVGRGWAELRGAPAVAAVGPQTRRGHQLWMRRVGPRAQYRAAAGLGGPGRRSAGPWATGCWGPLVTLAGRGRCPRSRSSRQAFPVLRPLQPKPPACVAGAQEAPGAGLTANGDQGQAWPQVSGIPSPTVLLPICLPVHLPVRPSIHLSCSLSLRTTRQPS